MASILIVCVIAATVALGVWNLTLWMGGRRKPVAVGAHLLLGIGGLEAFVVTGGAGSGSLGFAAAALLAAALGCGLLGAVVRRSYGGAANVLLAAHALCGASGLGAALVWALRA